MSPSFNHAYIHAKLTGHLTNNTEYTVLAALTLDINGKDYIPDISVYPKMKPDRLNDKIKMSEMPLTVIEILSPTQGSQEVIEKFRIYFEAGIKSCWLVEPVMQGVIVCSGQDKLSTFFEKEIVDTELNIRVPVDAIFT